MRRRASSARKGDCVGHRRGVMASSGFTIIELLVAITIISVLIGILIPVIPKVRDSARQTVCQSNLRQIGLAVSGYQEDNRQEFPRARYMPRPWLSADEDPPLNEALNEYLESDSQVWTCPGDQDVHTAEYADDDGIVRECGVSYTYTTAFSGRTFEDTFFSRFIQLRPHEVPVLHDYDGGSYELELEEWYGEGGAEFDEDAVGALIPIDYFHSKRSYLYADGSVGLWR